MALEFKTTSQPLAEALQVQGKYNLVAIRRIDKFTKRYEFAENYPQIKKIFADEDFISYCKANKVEIPEIGKEKEVEKKSKKKGGGKR